MGLRIQVVFEALFFCLGSVDMAGKGGKGLIASKTTAPAANKDSVKKKSISRSSRAGIHVSLKPHLFI